MMTITVQIGVFSPHIAYLKHQWEGESIYYCDIGAYFDYLILVKLLYNILYTSSVSILI